MMNELKRNLVAVLTRGEYGMLCKTHMETVLAVPLNLEKVSKGDLITSDHIIGRMRRELLKDLKAYAKHLSDNHQILIWVDGGMKDEEGITVLNNTTADGMVSYFFTVNVSTRQELSEEKRSRLLGKIHNMLEERAMTIVVSAIKSIIRIEERDLIYEALQGK